jgi:antirestriction protein
MEGGHQEQQPIPEPEARAEEELTPRIYVASLSDYNAGRLHGTWIDASLAPDEMHDAITGMLQASPTDVRAEEWAIHDFEGFNGLHLGEWEDLGHVSKVANGIKEHGLAYAHWATLVSTDEELDQFEERYLGQWPSRTEYASDVLDDLGLYEQVEQAVSDNLRPYVTLDAEGFGRDLELGGDISVVDLAGSVYIFSNR